MRNKRCINCEKYLFCPDEKKRRYKDGKDCEGYEKQEPNKGDEGDGVLLLWV